MINHSTTQSEIVSNLMNVARSYEVEGKLNEASDVYRHWLRSHPNDELSVMIWYEYGRLMQLLGFYDKAESSFRASMEQNPNFIEGALALGKSLESQGKFEEAIDVWLKKIPPESAQIQILNNIARVSEGLHSPERTEQALIRSLKLDNTQDSVITTLLQQRQKLCRWPVITQEIGVPVDMQESNIGPLMSLALFDDPNKNLASVQSFLQSKGYLAPVETLIQKGAHYSNHSKLRVGFLSADFRLHATSVFFSSLIEHLDKSEFEIYLLDITTASDPFPFARQNLIATADHLVQLQNMDDAQAAHTIRGLEIDILVDMAGMTAGARPGIVSRRPAPIQMAYLGFIASCGIPNIDFVVTTEDLFPEDYSSGFTEKPLKLAGNYLAFTDDNATPTQTTREMCGLPQHSTVFCALLNTYKITPHVYAAWMRILHGVPESVLWLVDENPTTKANLIAHAKNLGITSDRLCFSQRVHPAEYRTRLGLADLFLDSSPYGNGATTRDVLLANLPILTKPGNTMMSRLTAHMVRAVGLDELIVEDFEAYVAKAIDLGNDKSQLAGIKNKLIDSRKTSDLYNTKKFAKDFGEGLKKSIQLIQS